MNDFRTRPLSLALLCALGFSASAGETPDDPVRFEHGDWELVCDNTGTCRAAGYQLDASEMPVSVLFTRAAGAGTTVTGEVAIGQDWNDDTPAALPAAVTLRIDNRAHGRIALNKDAGTGALTKTQVAALLASLRRDSLIEFQAEGGKTVWKLSDTGASAVFLKMDEAQGRIGTVGALHRKGKRDESKVPAAKPKPIVRAAGATPAQRGDDEIAARHDKALRTALRAADPERNCMDLHDTEPTAADTTPEPLDVHRLDAKRLLMVTRCWTAAYNFGYGYWIVDHAPPFRATLVTADGNSMEIDATLVEISASHKGRGLGDCWSHDARTWDGTRFVHTAASGSGMCRGFPGGAWPMPSLVTEVVKAAAAAGGKKSR